MDYSTLCKSSLENVKFGARNPVVALLLNVSAWTCLLAAAAKLSHKILIIGASPRTTRFNLFVYLKRVEIHSPTPGKTMTDFTQRLITTIRTETCNIAKEIVRDGDMSKTDLPFNLDNPGDDPHFHEICKSIAVMMEDHMHDLITQAITGEY